MSDFESSESGSLEAPWWMSFKRSNKPINPDETEVAGYLLLFVTFLFFVFNIYTVVISKFMPEVGHPILDFLRTDYYYCLLVPLLIPVVIVSAYLNWLGLKFFRHNA